jgi:flagellar motor switch protein FliN/FliY
MCCTVCWRGLKPMCESNPESVGGEAAAWKLAAGDLPHYTRSLLRIKIPVMVTLASKRQTLWGILELGPGSIIHFEKSCEEMLDLEAAGHRIACGEAVKVGDKFGLRVTSVRLPDERFQAIKRCLGE